MADLTFPEIDSLSPLLSTSPVSTPPVSAPVPVQTLSPTPAVVPDLGIKTTPVSVPSVLSQNQTTSSGAFQPIPEWTYRRFQLSDILYSKIGISAITSLFTFSILSVINPPFVQESNDNPIEISKPSLSVLYCISLVIFVIMMVVPMSK